MRAIFAEASAHVSMRVVAIDNLNHRIGEIRIIGQRNNSPDHRCLAAGLVAENNARAG